jgi:hypothetical protein
MASMTQVNTFLLLKIKFINELSDSTMAEMIMTPNSHHLITSPPDHHHQPRCVEPGCYKNNNIGKEGLDVCIFFFSINLPPFFNRFRHHHEGGAKHRERERDNGRHEGKMTAHTQQ